MKKIILGVLVVGVGIAVLVNRISPASKATGSVPDALSRSTTPIPLPKTLSSFQKPETIAQAQKKIRESTELLQKHLIPLMKQMPDEVKKMEALIKKNDELINGLARTGAFAKPDDAVTQSQN